MGRLHDGHAHLGGTDDQAADDVDDDDDDAGDGIPFDELHRTVHRTVELALLLQVGAEAAGGRRVDDAGAEVGVDRHLLTRHSVQAETGGYLCDPLGTLGDDDELD